MITIEERKARIRAKFKDYKPKPIKPIKVKAKEPINYESYWQLLNATSHTEFENKLRDIILKRDEREEFYRGLLEIDNDLSKDTFKPYFEIYSAERKTNQQDYTPEAVASILSFVTCQGEHNGESKYTAYDMTAGTGTLLINKWHDDRMQELPWSYAPHRYFYLAEELADNSIPYLIHNFAMRGMNAIVIHGDSLHRTAKQVYFIQNSKDDILAFSDINVMPHNETVLKEFNLTEWTQEPIEHIESQTVVFQHAEPSIAKMPEVSDELPKYEALIPWRNVPKMKDLAFVERAQEDKIYPKNSIVIQMSATRGQFGLLTSDGVVGSQYAVITFHYWLGEQFPEYVFNYLHTIIPHWFSMRQEGLNIKLEDIEQMPLTRDLFKTKVPIKYGQQSLF